MGLSSLDDCERNKVKQFIREANKRGTNAVIDELLENAQLDDRNNNKRTTMLFQNSDIQDLDSSDSFDLDDSELWNHEITTKDAANIDSESEEDDILKNNETTKHYCIIPLDSRFKFIWDHLQLVLMIYVATAVPFKLCYIEEKQYPNWDYLDNGIDILFALDIVINFFTPLYQKERINFSHVSIALSYLKFWFWIDILSVIPFDIIINSEADIFSNYSILLKISKMPRLYKFMKGAKMLRTIKVQKKGRKTFVGKMVNFFTKSEHVAFSILPLYIIGLSIAHIFSCIWFFMADNSGSDHNWLERYGFLDEQLWDRYCASLYYIYTTFSTTGYGDIVPGTTEEFIATIIFIISGVTFHSLIFTTIMDKINAYSSKNKFYNDKRELLQTLVKKDEIIDTRLYREMLIIINENQSHNTEEEFIPSFSKVKPTLVDQMILEICNNKYHFNTLDFLNGLSKRHWVLFYETMEEKIYTKGEIIFEAGSPSSTFFVVKRGKVWLMTNLRVLTTVELNRRSVAVERIETIARRSKSRSRAKIITEEEYSNKLSNKVYSYPFAEIDSFFGELELLNSENEGRLWSCIAKKNTIVYTIPKSVFQNIFNSNEFIDVARQAIKKRYLKFRRFEDNCRKILREKEEISEKIEKKKIEIQQSLRKSVRISNQLSSNDNEENEWIKSLRKIQDQYKNEEMKHMDR